MGRSFRLTILLFVSLGLVLNEQPLPSFSAEFNMKCGTPDPADGTLSRMAT
ncbi:MAG: hypothetical protein OEU26_24335 [Candidatus Tectomicrobia bacterium]|nr:hypothetical protein [Candidatus Tectomicrobia bacterium]